MLFSTLLGGNAAPRAGAVQHPGTWKWQDLPGRAVCHHGHWKEKHVSPLWLISKESDSIFKESVVNVIGVPPNNFLSSQLTWSRVCFLVFFLNLVNGI